MDTYKIKNPYNIVFMIFGVIIILFSLSLATINIAFLFLFPIALPLIIADEGWEFNRAKEEFREYSSNLGFTRGKWKSSNNLSYLSIISTRMTSSVLAPPGFSGSISTSDMYFKLILLNEKHSKKIDVFASTNPEEVKTEGKELAKFLGIPLVKFSPPVSKGRR